MAHVLSPEAQLEVSAWNSHRQRHRSGVSEPVVRGRRRAATAAHGSIRAFARAMQIADKHRGILKNRFGFNDQQIGSLAFTALKRARGLTRR